MKLTILQENLHKALGKTIRILVNKPQLPILAHVLISAKEGIISLTTTNMETSIQIVLAGKIEEEGDVCVPARLLFELISSLQKDSVTITTKEESLLVQTSRTKATLPGVAATEFPPLPDFSSSQGVDLPNDTLRMVLSLVIFSAATDESRPLLTGIRVENTEEGTTFVATDGYRLSLKKIPGEKLSENALVIPARAMSEVLRIAGEEKDQSQVRMSETIDGQLLFTIADTKIITRRIEGEYPNYRRIIPTAYTTEMHVETQELIQAVKSAAIFAKDSAGIIRFSISASGLVVSANTPQVGENTIEVEASVEGDGGELALNSKFLLDILSSFPSKELLLQMTGSLNPAVFLIPEDESFLHIIMPVRIQA